jgi:hypothetical protein
MTILIAARSNFFKERTFNPNLAFSALSPSASLRFFVREKA